MTWRHSTGGLTKPSVGTPDRQAQWTFHKEEVLPPTLCPNESMPNQSTGHATAFQRWASFHSRPAPALPRTPVIGDVRHQIYPPRIGAVLSHYYLASCGPELASRFRGVFASQQTGITMNLNAVRVFVKDIEFYSGRLTRTIKATDSAYGMSSMPVAQSMVEPFPTMPEEDRALVNRFTGLSFTVLKT